MAGGLGFEPRLAESESAVLPLDDPPNRLLIVSVQSDGSLQPRTFVNFNVWSIVVLYALCVILLSYVLLRVDL